ncbi:MAG: serine hydrolase [Planctomycetota bacterium]|jgi:CubicO group peptidase (beta-lactamase class C family)
MGSPASRRPAFASDRARGYSKKGESYVNARYMHPSNAIGGGDLLSTVDDLTVWLAALHDDSLFSETGRELMLETEPIEDQRGQRMAAAAGLVNVRNSGSYARGWFVGTQSGEYLFAHSGGIHGFAAYAGWFPEKELTIVILSNVEQGRPMLQAAVSLGRAIL